MNCVHGMARVTCGWSVVEEYQDPGYETVPAYYPKEWGWGAAEAFVHETEHDHIQFGTCNQRQREGLSGEEEAINRKVGQLGGCCKDAPKRAEGLYQGSGGIPDEQVWADPRDTNEVEVQDFRPMGESC